MRLVGVAGCERQRGEVVLAGVERADEPPEAQHARKRLRPVARGGPAAPAQLPLAAAAVARDLAHAIVLEPRGSGDDERIGAAPGDRPQQPAGGVQRRSVRIDRERAVDVGRLGAQVAQLVQRHAERPAARGRMEAHADEHVPRAHRRELWARVRARDRHAVPAAPDQIRARVGHDADDLVDGGDAHPRAGNEVLQPGRRRKLAVSGSDRHVSECPTVAVSCKTPPLAPDELPAMTSVDLDAAERFLAGHGRVLDRRRFDQLFRGGPSAPVRDAVAAYANDDGGFGHALEPDGRGPESQPAAVLTALTVLDASDAWDEELVERACDWLASVEPQEGGATFVLPGVERWPHGPWWAPQEGLPASPTTTGQLVAPLLRRGVEHPWLERATAWLWQRADEPGTPDPYDMLGLTAFLDAVPDRDRATAAIDGLAEHLERALVRRPDGPPDEHHPLEYAPAPDSVARRVFGAERIDADLDRLAAEQHDDGGWDFTWLKWSPVAAAEWRAVVTVEALSVLRANGRL